MIRVGVAMLTSTPALAAQACQSVLDCCPDAVDLRFALNLWEVEGGRAFEFPFPASVGYFGRGDQVYEGGPVLDRFNFSILNNVLAREFDRDERRPDFFLFLNDDTCAPAGSGFLGAMIRAAAAGASEVGLKLVYPPGATMGDRIQHAGVYRGPSGTGAHRGLYADPAARAYSKPSTVPVWAVTGACVLVRPEDFWKVGGFDEGYAKIWQDIDLSLKLRERTGRPVVCVQDEWIYHFEGATQGGRFDDRVWWETQPDTEADMARFMKRWPPWRDNGHRARDD